MKVGCRRRNDGRPSPTPAPDDTASRVSLIDVNHEKALGEALTSHTAPPTSTTSRSERRTTRGWPTPTSSPSPPAADASRGVAPRSGAGQRRDPGADPRRHRAALSRRRRDRGREPDGRDLHRREETSRATESDHRLRSPSLDSSRFRFLSVRSSPSTLEHPRLHHRRARRFSVPVWSMASLGQIPLTHMLHPVAAPGRGRPGADPPNGGGGRQGGHPAQGRDLTRWRCPWRASSRRSSTTRRASSPSPATSSGSRASPTCA